MRSLKLLLSTSLIIFITACSDMRPRNAEDLTKILQDNGNRICTIDMSRYKKPSGKYDGFDSSTATILRVIDTLQNQPDDPWALPKNGYGNDLLLNARAHVVKSVRDEGTIDAALVNSLYDEKIAAAPKAISSNSLQAHAEEIQYWVLAEAEYESVWKSSRWADDRREYCIVYEQLSIAAAKARDALLKEMDAGTVNLNNPAAVTIVQFANDYTPKRPNVFLNAVLKYALLQDEMTPALAHAIFLGRGPESMTRLDSDPKQADLLIEQHRREAQARIDVISQTQFPSKGKEILERSNISHAYVELSRYFAVGNDLMDTDEEQAKALSGFNSIQEEVSKNNAEALRTLLQGDMAWLRKAQTEFNQNNIPNRLAGLAMVSNDLDVMKKTVETLEFYDPVNKGFHRYGVLVDKIELSEGREQIYGTQGVCKSKSQFDQFPISNSETAKQLRDSKNIDPNTDVISGIVMACQYYPSPYPR